MTLEERVRAWSYRRQGLGRTGSDDLLANVANTVAVFASQPSAILTLAARAPQADPAAFARSRRTASPFGSRPCAARRTLWTMGYARGGRVRIVRSDDEARLFANNADGMGAVLRGGLAIAARWLRFRGSRMEVDLDLFVDPPAAPRPAPVAAPRAALRPTIRPTIEDRLAEIATLLGASGFDVVEGPPRGRRLA
jgi:hypothetical protein